MNIFYYFPDHYKYIIQTPKIITLHIICLELLKELTKMEIKGYIVALIMAMMMMELASLTLATSRRSMLTNGIGLTPPMGYVVFLALFPFLFFNKYTRIEFFFFFFFAGGTVGIISDAILMKRW